VSGVALFALSFLHWLGGKITKLTINGRSIPSTRYEFHDNAWAYTATLLAVLIGLLMLAYVAARLAGMDRPRSPVLGRVLVALGALAFVLVGLQLLAGPTVNLAAFGLPSTADLGGAVGISFVKTRDVGIYAGLVATVGLAGGGYLLLKER
jgi:Kef-type K+ transport system membrane component KefB